MSFWWLFLGEASLAVVAAIWAWLRGVSISYRVDLAATGIALAATAAFVLVNFTLYFLSKRAGRLGSVHAFLESEVFPLFRPLPVWKLLLLSSAAGVGEELLFRGVIQEELGLPVASVVFGLMHGPTRDLWPLALWATAMGAGLGVLYQASGNVFVPVVSHALYDGAALVYIGTRAAFPPVTDGVSEEGLQ